MWAFYIFVCFWLSLFLFLYSKKDPPWSSWASHTVAALPSISSLPHCSLCLSPFTPPLPVPALSTVLISSISIHLTQLWVRAPLTTLLWPRPRIHFTGRWEMKNKRQQGRNNRRSRDEGACRGGGEQVHLYWCPTLKDTSVWPTITAHIKLGWLVVTSHSSKPPWRTPKYPALARYLHCICTTHSAH